MHSIQPCGAYRNIVVDESFLQMVLVAKLVGCLPGSRIQCLTPCRLCSTVRLLVQLCACMSCQCDKGDVVYSIWMHFSRVPAYALRIALYCLQVLKD